MASQINICFIGGTNSGKSTFLRTHLKGQDATIPTHNPTMGLEVSPLVIDTNIGTFQVNVWDMAGDRRFHGLRTYPRNGVGAIAFYTKDTLEETNAQIKDYQQEYPNAKIVNVWNKSDNVVERKFFEESKLEITHQGGHPTYQVTSHEISPRPFQELLQQVTTHYPISITHMHVPQSLQHATI